VTGVQTCALPIFLSHYLKTDNKYQHLYREWISYDRMDTLKK
jgi:hypothetical protein